MKKPKLTAPPTSKLAARNGGNGGYNRKSSVEAGKFVRRKRDYKDYHGNSTRAK